ncbi:amidase [Actinomadura kijaniata]|uniref:amidase n=1 Tax=Actinomadura kijaniata TaxID=46161 RepID=UPI00082E9F73|nr:amidase [Actinomadura kijaniata]
MEISEYVRHDATGLRELLAKGEVTAAEVEDAARAALDRADAELNALALPPFEPALAHDAAGPFAGVPFLIKDIGPMAEGVPFFAGSRALDGLGIVAPYDRDLMRRFRAAGLVTLGLTTAPELALSLVSESPKYGVTRNPWDLGRDPGGSSSGAAALVAARAVPVAHGGDGAGSLRVPAAACGLVGLKPSRGRIPCGPDMGEPMFGMVGEFALTRTVRDAARLLDAVHGAGVGDKCAAPPPRRPYAEEIVTGPGRLRVAVMTRAWSGTPVAPEVAAVAEHAARALEAAGHHVTEAGPALSWEAVLHGMLTQSVANGASFLLAPREPHPDTVAATTRSLLAQIKRTTALDLLRGFRSQNEVTRAAARFFLDHDVLVTPTTARPPLPHGTLDYDAEGQTMRDWLVKLDGYSPFTMAFNVSGHPAISLPLGWSADGLPIGVQLVAAHDREDLLLGLAARLEEEIPWRDRIPPHAVG